MFSSQNSINAREVPLYKTSISCQPYAISLNQPCLTFTNQNSFNQLPAISYPQSMNNVQVSLPSLPCRRKSKVNSSPFMMNQNRNKINGKRKHSNAPRKKFSPKEDEKLKDLVETMGCKKWELIAKEMPGRTGRQCRDRYQNYLIPGYFNGQWSKTEDDLLFKLYMQYGSQWSKMSQFFSNRSANSLKNRWNYFVSRHMTDSLSFNYVQQALPVNNIENVSQVNDKTAEIPDEEENFDQNADVIYENVISCSNSMDFMYIEPLNENDELNNKGDYREFPYISNEIILD